MSDYILSCSASCDLTPEWMKKRDLHYVNFNIIVDGKNTKDDMGITISPRELVRKMQNGVDCKTSMVSIGEYSDYFRPFLEAGKDLIHVSLSSGISGTYNSACQAAEIMKEEFPDRKIFIIDSLAASSGYGLLMELAADKRDQGLSVDELAKWIEDYKLNVIHWFFSTDLSFYIKGGRISKTAGTVGQVLNICPLLNVDFEGRLIPREKIRTKKKVVKRIVEKMIEDCDDGFKYSGKVFMSDTDEELGNQVQSLIEEIFPQLKGKIERFDIGCTIASHTGPGTVALFFQGKKRTN
ncbi:MAG: DegV family protein [Eubacterium sp.]|nr:DegV family protein [Eubacterium sp.]